MKVNYPKSLIAASVSFLFCAGLSAQEDLLVSYVASEDWEHDPAHPPVETSVPAHISASDLTGSEGKNILIKNPTNAWVEEPHFAYSPGDGLWAAEERPENVGYTFTVTADEGHSFTITEVSFRGRATDAGPDTVGVRVNGIDFGDGDAISTTVNTFTEAITGLEEVTEATFYIQGWDSAGTGNGEFQMNNLQVSGTVIPEPSTYAAVAGGVFFLTAFFVRRLQRLR